MIWNIPAEGEPWGLLARAEAPGPGPCRAGGPRATRFPLVVPLALLLAAGCVTVPEEPPGPPPFRGIGRLVLVREVDRPEVGRRPKDPLDALGESLAARGKAAREVEVGPLLREDLRGVRRLYDRIEERIAGGPPPGWRGRPVERVGGDVGALLDRLGVDAAVLYYPPRPRAAPPPLSTLEPMEPTQPAPAPVGALAVVDREGELVWFDWGGDERGRAPSAPASAAEAVEEVLRVITGGPPPEV
jgi:hypothetical protein